MKIIHRIVGPMPWTTEQFLQAEKLTSDLQSITMYIMDKEFQKGGACVSSDVGAYCGIHEILDFTFGLEFLHREGLIPDEIFKELQNSSPETIKEALL